MCLVLNIFINTKTSKPVSLPQCSIIHSGFKDRWFCQSSRGLRRQCNKTEGQFNKFDSMGILQLKSQRIPSSLYTAFIQYFLLFLSGHFCLPFTKNGWVFSFSIHKVTRRKSIGYTQYEITPPLHALWRGGGLFATCSQGKVQPCEAASWDQTASSFSCSSLHFPLNPLTPLFPLSVSSAPLQPQSSLLFIFLSL